MVESLVSKDLGLTGKSTGPLQSRPGEIQGGSPIPAKTKAGAEQVSGGLKDVAMPFGNLPRAV